MSIGIEVIQGDSPLVLGLPHTGTTLPQDVWDALNEQGRALSDTDWHIERLYAELVPGVTTVRTPIHRYAIDVNRDPDGASLYPGQNTTGLCPLTDFDGQPIYRAGAEPGAEEIAQRRQMWHAPYHEALGEELARVRNRHGFAVLYDCHSIRSEIPFLFAGSLPDFNIGTDGGTTCERSLARLVVGHCAAAEGYTHVLNGRFRGGWTTRHYGRPKEGLHAIQMELAQSTYMEERPPWSIDAARAARLRPILARLLTEITQWRPA